MSDHKFLIYHRDDDVFVLFDNGKILDVFEETCNTESWGKILLQENNIYFQHENQSFAKIKNDKITSQYKKLNVQKEKSINIIVKGNKYEFYKKYLLINSKKTVRIPNSNNMECYGIFNIGNHLICIFDFEPGYCEVPGTFVVVIDLISKKIINSIDLKNFDGDYFSCVEHNDKLYLISTNFDEETCPAGDYCILLIFDGKSYKTKYIFVNKNKKICKSKKFKNLRKKMDHTFSASSTDKFICFSSDNELIIYDIIDETATEYDYSYGEDGYLHSFVPIL
ncbi:hypothetical protein ma888 [Moumouvirus australiensis]|uniref:Uncharacterized protein n=1 Tax=Moumouvirus australiensis TaxID=2109587 RepID=A0A2P1EMZ5_9VIRU|nr:hypothetical protein QKC55_gp016 [Moumouvirus australiensis]AVL95275.1 hypothetical protein ma888 [Moumouvirus australiensis]